MIKNKAFHAIIIGTCILASSMAGVYADTTPQDTPVSIQIAQVNANDPLVQKQAEIDQYVFEKHVKEFADKGIAVTNTGVAGDYVEIGISPYSQESADYLYGIFGKDQIKVVEGFQAVTMGPVDAGQDFTVQITSEPAEAEVISAPVDKEVSPIAAFFSNILEWIKNLF